MAKSTDGRSSAIKGLSDVGGRVGQRQLRRLVREASQDSGGGWQTPPLFQLIQDCLLPETREKVRFSIVTASIEYVGRYLGKAGRDEVVTFLQFLSSAELLSDSPRLEESLLKYVDRNIVTISANTSDVAIVLLRRGVGRGHAQSWLPKLRRSLSSKPEWPTIDVLAELSVFLPQYRSDDLIRDIRRLSDTSDYLQNVEMRRNRWKRLDISQEDLLRSDISDFSLFPRISPFLAGLKARQGTVETVGALNG